MNASQQLKSIIETYTSQLQNVEEYAWSYKPNPFKWSKKETFGHLIDSAQNNVLRFVVAQYEDNPKITYEQDNWVASSNYQNYITKDLTDLWILFNKHICMVLDYMPDSAEERLSETNKVHSIKGLAEDYHKHLLQHLHQVLDLEPISYI